MQAQLIAERFEIVELASSGGMGRVYRARDWTTGAPAALKVLHPGSVEQGRFEREGAILAELQHPGIVRHLAHGRTAQGELYLAMEWLSGEDLAQRLKRQPLSLEESVTLGIRVAEALHEAHRRGVIHRDIKPANLLLVEGMVERVKIVDFGVARPGAGSRGAGPSLTQSGILVGTPGFISPEQARGERAIDARADLFSLGCVLFQCLTGRPPFVGDDILAVLLKVALEEAPRARRLRDDIPPELDALLARMLAKAPDGRPADGRAVATELAGIQITSGSPRPVTSPPPAVTATEQRLLCVLVARAEGAGSPADSAEDGHDHEADELELTSVIERHGGKLHLLVDGSLFVTLTGADAATDQAVKAARCALAARACLPGVPMALVAGRAVLSRSVPMGTAIDRGVSLLRHGSTPEVRLDGVIAGLLDGRFDVRSDAFGKLLFGERDLSEGTFKLLGAPTRCVGRDPAIQRLASIFEECASDSIAQPVLVTAPAGTGKSRLQHEFIRRIRHVGLDLPGSEPALWIGRADLMSAGSPFSVLASALRSAFGVHRGEPLAARQQKIEARVSRWFAGAEGARNAALLGEIAGVPFPEERLEARADLRLLGDQMRRAFLAWTRAEASAAPVMLILDDLQWGDLPSISFIDTALRDLADKPIMVLALARPEVHDAFPGLFADRGLVEVKLGPLSRRASEQMVRDALGDAATGPVIEAVVTRGAGNAFYLEELIRAVAEGRGDALPETVLAMTEARLDRLDPGARRALRAASIFGEIFWKQGVLALLGDDEPRLDELLADLTVREVIARRDTTRFPGDEEYAFRHALVQDAAYAMLTDEDRTRGHALAGAFLERAGEEDATTLAEHFERGDEPARSLGWYFHAAKQALEGSDLEGASARAERAIRCGASGELLGRLRLLQGEAHTWGSRPAEAARCWGEGLSLFPRGSPLWCQSAGGMLMADMQLGNLERFSALAHELHEAQQQTPVMHHHYMALDSLVVTYLCAGGLYAYARSFMDRLERAADPAEPVTQSWLGWARCVFVSHVTADPWLHLHVARAAVESFNVAGDRRGGVRLRIELGIALRNLGAYAEAERIMREAFTAAKSLSTPFMMNVATHHLGVVLLETGKLDEALEASQSAALAYARTNNKSLSAASRANLAMILLRRGDLDAARREADEALGALHALPVRVAALALVARVRLASGEIEEAITLAEEAMARLGELGAIPDKDAMVRLVHAEAVHAAGRRDDAYEAITEAKARLLRRAAWIEDAELRRSFLEDVEENRCTLAWAATHDAPWGWTPRGGATIL